MDLVYKRNYYSFISHAHADKRKVDQIYDWLVDVAQVPVWYDARNLPPAKQIVTFIGDALKQCRSIIIVLSKTSVESGWVKEEYEIAVLQRASSYGEFSIIPILIEDCIIPIALQTTKWIDMRNGQFGIDAASELLLSLYKADVDLELGKTKDVYVSCSWRSEPLNEYYLSNAVCAILANEGIRLIGDSRDQKGFRENRVESIISSCGSLIAILPERGNKQTSPYMIKEIEIAKELGIPFSIIVEDTVELPESIIKSALFLVRISKDEISDIDCIKRKVNPYIEMIKEEWKEPIQPHYIFWGMNLSEVNRKRNILIKRIIERVTAMPCVMGEDLREGQIQEAIKEKIVKSFVMIADISEENLNTCIEAGIARGANIPLHLIAQGPRRKPPFMFRDQQIWYYDNDKELLGKMHKIIYPYRRRIINFELYIKV